MAVAEISVMPVGKGEGLSEYVAIAYSIAKNSGLRCELTPMGTVLEGDVDKIFQLAQKMHLSLFDKGAQRVITHLKLDERRDKVQKIEERMQSVMDKAE
jgi:uncharacterized protein (TIGR00106 family)